MTKHFPDSQPQPRSSAHSLSFGCPGASLQGPSVSLADAVTSVVLAVVIVSTAGSGGLVVAEVGSGAVSVPGIDGSAIVVTVTTPLDGSPSRVGAGAPLVAGAVADDGSPVTSAGRSGEYRHELAEQANNKIE